MKINVLKVEKMNFEQKNEILYKVIGSLSGPEFVRQDETIICYSKEPLTPLSDYDIKLKVSSDMKSIKLSIGKQINPAKM